MSHGGPLRVLFLVRDFPPKGGSSVQRPAKYVKYLEPYRCRVHVVAEQDFHRLRDESMLREIPPSVRVQRAFSIEPDCLGKKIEEACPRAAVSRGVLKALLKLYSVLYYRTVPVDWSFGWVPFAIRAGAEIVRRERIELLYAVCPPATTFLAAWRLKKRFGLPLVLDYADPWTTEPEYPKGTGFLRLNRPVCEYLEDRCLRSADRVIYCKPSICETVRNRFRGLDPDKFVFLPNGYDPDDFPKTARGNGSSRYRIVYTGKLTNRYCYSPRSFFSALRALLDEEAIREDGVEVVLAGIASPEHLDLIDRYGLRRIVRHEGYVDHRCSAELVQSADALLLLIESPLGRKTSESYAGSLPAKIFEYLYAGKPILGIVPEGDEAVMLRRSGLGYIAEPNDPASVKRALLSLLNARGQAAAPDWGFIRNFDRRELTGRLASVFHSLSARTRETGAPSCSENSRAASDGFSIASPAFETGARPRR